MNEKEGTRPSPTKRGSCLVSEETSPCLSAGTLWVLDPGCGMKGQLSPTVPSAFACHQTPQTLSVPGSRYSSNTTGKINGRLLLRRRRLRPTVSLVR